MFWSLNEDGSVEKSDGFEFSRIALSEVGDVVISTVFLSVNHSWDQEDPVLFETMVLTSRGWEHQVRYRTLAEAKDGHAAAVREWTTKCGSKEDLVDAIVLDLTVEA